MVNNKFDILKEAKGIQNHAVGKRYDVSER
jgi:hypothetical protein